MDNKLAWGIIGLGGIARAFAQGLKESRTGRLVAVGSRAQATADRFGEEFGAPRRHGSYEALLADPEVKAVYISTPHPMHAEWAISAAGAGKHILCEKPIGINQAEARAMVEAARQHDVFLMEAFMYRCHPQTAKLVELIRDHAIGEVRVIEASLSFNAGFDPESRLFKNSLAGGGILDVGCYCVSMSRLIAGAAAGRDFAEPTEVKGCGRLGDTGVDEWAIACLKFPGDILAYVATGVRVSQENVVRIFGSEGWMLVTDPWFPGGGDIVLHRAGEPTVIPMRTEQSVYAMEADVVAASIANRQAPSPAMTWEDTLGNMAACDRWRESIGLVYDSER